jgi:DNA-binding NarL/FixJ family response regulator
MDRIRVVIADDQTLFASSLRVVLEGHGKDEIEVVGIASDGMQAVSIVEKLMPDVILMDVRMPGMDGVEATRQIHARFPSVKIMILTTFDDDEYVFSALDYGASGYVLKNVQPPDLINSIKVMHQGNLLLSPDVAGRLMIKVHRAAGSLPHRGRNAAEINYLQSKFPALSRREAEVLCLVSQNLDNHEIAEALYIAEQTVKNYTTHIYAKLGVEDRLHVMQLLSRRT